MMPGTGRRHLNPLTVSAPSSTRERESTMVNKSGDIGTHTATAVVKYIRANGFGTADRHVQKGSLDEGDITGTPGVCWEVKGGNAARRAGPEQVRDWLAEAEVERRNVGAVVTSLVMARTGYGYPRAGMWWVIVTAQTLAELWAAVDPQTFPAVLPIPLRMTLADWCVILRAAGYGDPL